MTSWVGRTAVEIAAAVREKRATPREVVAEHLARIERLDAQVGAFRTLRTEAALAEADELATRDLSGLPLAGVPVAVKDNLAVRGESTRNGSAATSGTPAEHDHVTVARLRAAGAVVVGLTNVPELCVFGTTDGVHGIARNPWDTSRTAGGSSGGSAAAVAAGMVPIALGNDGMGSLRIPAAHCGLVGLKPGHGTVPAGIGHGDWFGMSENGPLATTVEDARLMFAVLSATGAEAAGEHTAKADTEHAAVGAADVDADAEHTADADAEVSTADADAEHVAVSAADAGAVPAYGPVTHSIALSLRSPLLGVRVTRPYTTAAREAAELLAEAGHRISSAEPPYPWWLSTTSLAHWTAGTAVDAEELDRGLLTRRTRVHAAVGRRFLRGVRGGGRREQLRRRMEPFFAEHDVLLTPALARRGPAAAPWHERGWLRNLLVNTACSPLTPTWNLTGWPALSVPFGTLPSGAPCAVQLVGRPGSELVLLEVAEQLEKLRPWRRTAPLD
ncbi:amidase [Streptomyces sp. NPDC058371]|uniref:amidase n=1 Tax=Streptomyces sp. NPDC058371 TaxID=3346463 RepID=UPI0036636E94